MAGLSLEQVKKEAEAAAKSVGSMGVAAQVCTLPGGEASARYLKRLLHSTPISCPQH